MNQTTTGTVASTHDSQKVLSDAFTYPLQVASNYSLYTQKFGKDLFTRPQISPLG